MQKRNIIKKKNAGFTLIELLVVVSIISLLSSVVLGSINNARKKAVDAAAVQDAKQLQNALELYYLTNKTYPSGYYRSIWTSGSAPTLVDSSNVTAAMAPFFKMPKTRYLASDSVFAYTDNNLSGVYNCGSTVSSGPAVPKYVIYFSSNYPLNLPYAYDADNVHYLDGTGGFPIAYCLKSQ